MYMCLNRLDGADQFMQLEFAVNFGIDFGTKNKFTQAMANGGTFEECVEMFDTVPTLLLLKLHRYLNWADKKLHSVFFIENKDQISEDLLYDFREGNSVTVK